MDYVDKSESLRKRMERGTNPFFKEPLKAVDGFIQLIEALAACEKSRIVHRDLSPANLLVTYDGEIKLIDFGLCQIDDGNTITLTEEAVGTPLYRAPECSGHSNMEPSIQADLYSAGKLLWSMITNKSVFDRETPVFNHLSLFKIFPDVPAAWHFHHIFESTIRHDPSKRFARAWDALERAKLVRRLIVDGFKPLEQLADTLCPLCGIGRYGNSFNLVTYYAKEMQGFAKAMSPVSGSYSVCPFCFHASFVAMEALEKALADRKMLV